MHRFAHLSGPLLAAAVCLGAAAGPAIQFSDTKLKNGLRILIVEDHSAPTFSVAVTYKVGSADERPGRTGFAHLFEHMMFRDPRTSGPASIPRSSSITAGR